MVAHTRDRSGGGEKVLRIKEDNTAVVPATQEAEAGELLEPWRWRM